MKTIDIVATRSDLLVQPTKVLPRLLMVRGEPLDPDHDHPAVGVYDIIRLHLRRDSPVQPLDSIAVERYRTGYRGVAVSNGDTFMFTYSSVGLAMRRLDGDARATMQYVSDITDRENEATAIAVSASDDKAQDDFNRNMSGVNSVQPGTAVPEDTTDPYTLMMQGPSKDTMERLPGRNRQINTQVPTEPMSAGGIVIRHDGKVLIVKPANGYGDYDWTFPKGHLEIEESMRYRDGGAEVAALREVYEETGFKCKLVGFVATVKHDDGGRCLYYEMRPKTVVPDETDGEMSEHRWVTTVEAMELLNDDKDISLLSVAHKNCPKLVLKATTAAKPYGHTSYTRKDPRTGKLINVKSKGVKPSDPVPMTRREKTSHLQRKIYARAEADDFKGSAAAAEAVFDHHRYPDSTRVSLRVEKRRQFRMRRARHLDAGDTDAAEKITVALAADRKRRQAERAQGEADAKVLAARDALEARHVEADPAHVTHRQKADLVSEQARNPGKSTLSELVTAQYQTNRARHNKKLAKEAVRDTVTPHNTPAGFANILEAATKDDPDWHRSGMDQDVAVGLYSEGDIEALDDFFEGYDSSAPSAHALGALLSSPRLGLVAVPTSVYTNFDNDDAEVSYSYKVYDTAGEDKETRTVHGIASDNEPVGTITRTFSVRNDEMHVHHSYFAIDKSLQGQGYAHEVISQADLMYEQLNVGSITVQANINIGGYTWAKFGFDWDEDEGAHGEDLKASLKEYVLERLDVETDGYGGMVEPDRYELDEYESRAHELSEARDELTTLRASLDAYIAEKDYEDFDYNDDYDLLEYAGPIDSTHDDDEDADDTTRYTNMLVRLKVIDTGLAELESSIVESIDAEETRLSTQEENQYHAQSEMETIDDLYTPRDIATYEFGTKMPGRDDYHKLGKQVMLGSDWHGVMHRDGNGMRVMEDYVRERLSKVSKSQSDDGDEGSEDDAAWARTVQNLGLDRKIRERRAAYAKQAAARKLKRTPRRVGVRKPGSRGGVWHRDANGNVMYGVRKSLSFDIAKASQHTGVMIAFILEPVLSAELALHTEGAEPASELHVTLAYLGKDLASDVIDRTREVVSAVASQYPYIEGTFGGIGRFCASPSSEGKDVIYASVDSSKLSMLREDLVQQLNINKVSIDRTHGYTPHMTLTYVSPDHDSPITRLGPVAFQFTRITIAVGGHQEHYDLAEFRKALARKTKAQKDEESKKETKPLKAGSKKTGAGGKVRYGYPSESKTKAPPKEGAAPKSKRPAKPDEPQSTKKPGQDPIIVPDDDNKEHKPQHTVSVSEFVKQTGATREQLDTVVAKYPDREKFILVMMTKLSSFAEKHGLDNDYFGLLHDVLTKRADPSPSDSSKPGSA